MRRQKKDYPVTNQQVRYVNITDSKIIASGNNAFQDYANETIGNIAKVAIQKIISSLNPYADAIVTLSNIFPSTYNKVKSYKNWKVGVDLQEEKVVQLSWVYVAGSPYFGAQTQFATIRGSSTITANLHDKVVDQTGFVYYRTEHYQHPENVARQNYLYDGWVESFALILPLFFGLDGVLYSMPVADILTFVISCIAIVFTYRSLKTTRRLSAAINA